MRKRVAQMTMSVALAALGLMPLTAEAQAQSDFKTVLERQFKYAEEAFISAAEAMPEEKYSYAPTDGEFKGVRTFAQQIKHVAVFNFRAFAAILGEKQPADGDNGPESLKTKAEIVKYMRDSFALGRRAIATMNAATVLKHVDNSPERGFDTPLDLIVFASWHAYDHYGQMVEYLRMNRIVPPASRTTPPANPSATPGASK